ncbi:SLATT domain-containing protein [Colwellia sp. C1TZA3]|uniref:SLATT domain-containing protein n=1 Tax=Colwellia sp. C1TZA3 TaxID=2508879 RepID=UPI0011B9F58B|nr:SLATT domain-containing protein [Colwellia sp. C1TZA3]TWX71400.1 SLATT domain-containing protein [Colwellia sp. C1TZA3]
MTINAASNKTSLNNRIWRTKGARFNAYRRLEKKNSALTFITAFSSIHLLAIAILQLSNLVTLSDDQSKLLNFISITISIIILAYSLFEGGKEHGLKSERHHLCGIELDRCYSKLQHITEGDTSELIKLTEDYNDVTEKYLLNHDTVDDEFFQLQYPSDFPNMHSSGFFNVLKVNFFYSHYDKVKAALFAVLPLLLTIKIIWG